MGVTNPERLRQFLFNFHRRGKVVDQGRTDTDRSTSVPIRLILSSIVAKAKRNGGWFKLNRLERGLVSLALRIGARFESGPLVRAIVSVLSRLKEVTHPCYEPLLRGAEIARAFAEAALAWGNALASSWKNDRGYALYLGLFLPRTGPR